MAKKKINLDWRVACTALVCIAGIEIYALSQGVNGLILASSIGVIAGITGYVLPNNLIKIVKK